MCFFFLLFFQTNFALLLVKMISINAKCKSAIPTESPTVISLDDDTPPPPPPDSMIGDNNNKKTEMEELPSSSSNSHRHCSQEQESQEEKEFFKSTNNIERIPFEIVTNKKNDVLHAVVVVPDDEYSQDVQLQQAKWKIIQQQTTISNLKEEIKFLKRREKKCNKAYIALEDELEETTTQLVEIEELNEQMKVKLQRLESSVTYWKEQSKQEEQYCNLYVIQRKTNAISYEYQQILETTKRNLLDLLEEELLILEKEDDDADFSASSSSSPNTATSKSALEYQLRAAKNEVDGTRQQVSHLERLLKELSGSKLLDKIQKLTQQMKETKEENFILQQTIELLEQERHCFCD